VNDGLWMMAVCLVNDSGWFRSGSSDRQWSGAVIIHRAVWFGDEEWNCMKVGSG
jgi:hypothetical protein